MGKIKQSIIGITAILLLPVLCTVKPHLQTYNKDLIPSPYKWETSDPEKQGLNSFILEKALSEIYRKSYYYSFLIFKNGYLVVEEYYNGQNAYIMNPIYSVTKSYISTSIGIAINQGYIESIDSKLLDFFPEYVDDDIDPRKFKITINHLLTMTAGFDHELKINNEMSQADNMIASIIASDLQFDPGSDFLYSTHGAHLLSGIIERATGMDTRTFLSNELLGPLGTEAFMWKKDQNGIYFGGAGMFLAPRDMARLGYLFLKDGKLEGKQIVDSTWIQRSTTNHRHYNEAWKKMNEVGYGHLWWTGKLQEHLLYFASGYGGQWILVIPDLNMVIVSTMNATTENDWEQMESLITIVNDYVITAINKE